MDRLFMKKWITSIFIIGFIFIFAILNFKVAYEPIKETIKNVKMQSININETIKLIENTINENVFEKYKFIDGYGYLQKLMNKNEESNFEVIKDKEGSLHYTFFAYEPNPVEILAERTLAFKNGIKNKDTKFIYLMTPDKYISGYTKFPVGIPYNYANETADNFLDLIKSNNISSIDLRENLINSGIPMDELFFKTDHHWKIETAFWGFKELVNKLNKEYNTNLDQDNIYTNKENYNFIEYKDSYVGSMGRKTGIYYSGVDDFNLIYPKYKTSYKFYAKTGEQEINTEGRFEDSLLTIYNLRVEKGRYALEGDKYGTYLFSNQGYAHIINKDNKNGPKVLFIKDSVAVPLATFLSTVCSDVYLLDPRYYNNDILAATNDIKDLDFVFMSFYPQDLTEEFFNF